MSADMGDLPLIVLAAGRSERMGRPKGLVDVHGECLAEMQQRRFAEAGGESVLFVLGVSAAAYLEELPGLSHVVNADVELGPFRSLQIGIRHALGSAPGVFVLPVDVPAPMPGIWRALAAALGTGTCVVRPRFQGRRGHPVLLGASFARRLLDVDPAAADARLDRQIALASESDPGRVLDWDVDDPQIVLNLNDPAALKHWLDDGSRCGAD